MRPREYQNKLMDSYRDKNQKNNTRYLDKVRSGVTVKHRGTLSGPYITMVSWFMDDGSVIDIAERSSLHWVPTPLKY